MDNNNIEAAKQNLSNVFHRIKELCRPIFFVNEGWNPYQRDFFTGNLGLYEMLDYWKRNKNYYSVGNLELIKNAELIIHTLLASLDEVRTETEKIGLILNGLVGEEVNDKAELEEAKNLVVQTIKAPPSLPGFDLNELINNPESIEQNNSQDEASEASDDDDEPGISMPDDEDEDEDE